MILAGLLACPIPDAFSSHDNGLRLSEDIAELTAAVSAQDFHLIPFSS